MCHRLEQLSQERTGNSNIEDWLKADIVAAKSASLDAEVRQCYAFALSYNHVIKSCWIQPFPQYDYSAFVSDRDIEEYIRCDIDILKVTLHAR